MNNNKTHYYSTHCQWSGQTGQGYEQYVRAHKATAQPAPLILELSADPAFRGDAKLLNPEQLLVVATSSCQLLSFLAVAARAGLDVRSYTDDATAMMPEDTEPVRIAHIELRPRIEIAKGPTEQRVLDVVRQAHDECYIANSLNSQVTINPSIVFV